MRITEDDIRKFFPRDMRFTHYVARKFGYTFKNKFHVEKANHIALEGVMSLYNRGVEFKDRSHLDGVVVNAFKFSILNSFKIKKSDKLNLIFESELFDYNQDLTGYSKYQQTAVDKSYHHYDNTVDVIKDELLSKLKKFDADVFKLLYDKQLKQVEISKKLNVPFREIEKSKLRIKTKLKQIIKNERDQFRKAKNQFRDDQQEFVVRKNSTQTNKPLQKESSNRYSKQNKKTRDCGGSAMLWINTDA